MGPIIEVQFKQGHRLGLRRALIEQYEKLAAVLTPSVAAFQVLSLEDISLHAGHVIVNYIHTGTYQTLKWLGPATGSDEAVAKLKTAFEVYASARKYDMPDLEKLAKDQVANLSKVLGAFLVVDVINEAYDVSSGDEGWFEGYLKEVIKKAFEKSTMVSDEDPQPETKAGDNSNVIAKSILRIALEVHREIVDRLPVKTTTLTLGQPPLVINSSRPEGGNKSTLAIAEGKTEKEPTMLAPGKADVDGLRSDAVSALQRFGAVVEARNASSSRLTTTGADGNKNDKNVLLQEGKAPSKEGLKVGDTPTVGNTFGALPAGKGAGNSSLFGDGPTGTGFGVKVGGASGTTPTGSGYFGSLPNGSSGTTGAGFGSSFGGGSVITSTGLDGRPYGGGFGSGTTGAQPSGFVVGRPYVGGFGGGTTGTGFGSSFGGGSNSGTTIAGSGRVSGDGSGNENTGTAKSAFSAMSERERCGTINVYQNNAFMDVYKNWSPEELRLADYAQGRKAGSEGTFARYRS